MYFIILRTYEQHKLENISKRKMKCLTLNNRLIPGINTGWLRFSDIHNMHAQNSQMKLTVPFSSLVNFILRWRTKTKRLFSQKQDKT